MNSEAPKPANDNCPEWAVELINKILVLEVEAGTIKSPSETGATSGWATSKLDELMKIAARMDVGGSQASTENIALEIEATFARVARGLRRDGHAPQAIAAMINARIPTGCRLPYCSTEEVMEALT